MSYIQQAQEYWQFVVTVLAAIGVVGGIGKLLASKLRADYCEAREKEHLKQIAAIQAILASRPPSDDSSVK